MALLPKLKERVTIYSTVTLPVYGPHVSGGTFQDMKDWARGLIATKLFLGRLDEALHDILLVAYARGKNDYHDDLLDQVKQKEKRKNAKHKAKSSRVN